MFLQRIVFASRSMVRMHCAQYVIECMFAHEVILIDVRCQQWQTPKSAGKFMSILECEITYEGVESGLCNYIGGVNVVKI